MLPKNKVQVTPSDITELQQNPNEAFLVQEFKIQQDLSTSKKDRCVSPQQFNHQQNVRTGEQSIEKTMNEVGTDFKKSETMKYPPLLRSDLTSQRWQIVANFIEKIKIYSLSLRFKKTKRSQLDIINDQSFNYEHFFHQNYFEQEVNNK